MTCWATYARRPRRLDLMNIQHGLQHLDIKPRNLFLVGNHVKVGDFGLVNSMRRGIPPRWNRRSWRNYAPLCIARAVRGSISSASDQYSLALVYHELLTGKLPFNGVNARQLLLQHLTAQPTVLAARRGPSRRGVRTRQGASRPISLVHGICAGHTRWGPATTERAGAAHQGIETDLGMADTGSVGEGTTDADYTEESEAGKETVSMSAIDTETGGTRPGTATTGETLAGHSLLRCLHTTPLTEVWKARSLAGSPRLVKCIFGIIPPGARTCEEAVVRLQACTSAPAAD